MKALLLSLLLLPAVAFAATPTLYFNTSTGSDTAASGSGGTAVTSGGNNAAATVATSSDVVLSADTPDLSGVATDGSAVMWVDATSGREFSAITGVNDVTDTVTCANFFANTEGSRNWGIGGKRNTLGNASSARLFTADSAPSWIIETETNQTLSATLGTFIDNAGIPITWRGTPGSRPVVNVTANAQAGAIQDGWKVENLQFTNSNAAHPRALSANSSGAIVFKNCVFGDATNTIASAIDRGADSPKVIFIDSEFKNCTSGAIASTANTLDLLVFSGCWIHDSGAAGISANADVIFVTNTIIEDNAGDGIALAGTNNFNLTVTNSTIDGNGGDGIDIATAGDVDTSSGVTIHSTNLTANGAFGIKPVTGVYPAFEDYNNFGTGGTANTSGPIEGLTIGSSSLEVDPSYTNGATNNFGVGTALKAEGFPDAARTIGANNSGTTSFMDIGAAQREEAASGATNIFILSE